MFVLESIITTVVVSVFLFAGLVAWLVAIPRIKARRLALLTDSRNRLRTITAELLEKANDIDQELKYRGLDESDYHRTKLKVAIDDLLTLSDTLPAIDQLVEEKKVNDCSDLLSASCRVADKVHGILEEIREPVHEKKREPYKLEMSPDSVIDVEVL